MKLDYRVVEATKGTKWSCNFCPYSKGKSSTATHEMVARKSNGYADVAYICSDCKKDFDNDTLPWCEKCGRIKRNRISCFCRLVEDKDAEPASEEAILAQAYSSQLENKTKELEKELSVTKEELKIEREEVAKFQEKSEEWSKKQKQELLDKIKSLEEKINHLEEENRKLKDQQNRQIAQIEVKENKRWSWLKIKK